jgi:hypothetical protein
MAMRYDVRTGMMQSDELAPNVPGWPIPGQHGLGQHGLGQHGLGQHGPGRRYTYDLRIGDAERDAAMDQLREHFAAGRLTLDELTERIDGALAAKTQTQIDALMADLPRPRKDAAPSPRSAEDASDTGRYVVSMLLLFALAAWLLMLAYMASRHGYGYTPPNGP